MKRSTRKSPRRGLTSVAVMVLLIVVGLMAASLVRLSVRYIERTRAHERALQSELLADSGLDRAYARLAADPSYTGEERWEIPAESLGSAAASAQPAAVVTIKIEPGSPVGELRGRRILVQADLPPDAPRRVRSSRDVVVPDAL